jgi:2-phosphoglycerate kinase
MNNNSMWTVLLIGGCSGTGKTTLATHIAHHFRASLGQTDDYRMALQNITSADTHPELHYFISAPGVAKEGIWESSPQVLQESLINVNKIVSKALEVVIEHHISTGNSIVLEGDGILPELAAKYICSESDSASKTLAVFLYEADKEYYFQNTIDSRDETHGTKSKEQLTIKSMHWLYSQWITRETGKYNIPLIQSRPWNTLSDRVMRLVQ